MAIMQMKAFQNNSFALIYNLCFKFLIIALQKDMASRYEFLTFFFQFK